MLNKREKFGAKIFPHYTDIVIFVLGYFILNCPVQAYSDISYVKLLKVHSTHPHQISVITRFADFMYRQQSTIVNKFIRLCFRVQEVFCTNVTGGTENGKINFADCFSLRFYCLFWIYLSADGQIRHEVYIVVLFF